MTPLTPATRAKSTPFTPSIDRIGVILLAAGVVLVVFAFVLQPVRASFGAIILYLTMVSIAVGSLFLIALEYISGAMWSVPMRRANEFLAGLTPFLILLALPLLLHIHELFHWSHAEAMAKDALLQGKAPYLNIPFFVLRTVGILGVWMLFAALFVNNSTKQDVTRDPALTKKNIHLAAVFLPVFAITITLTAIDWGMSLEAHWFSTIYGVYYFSGTVIAALAAGTLVVLGLARSGSLPKLRPDHYYSLGALMFGFVNFWAYIAFSQFLLIWYANLPEETYWFMARWRNGWEYVSVLLILVQFLVPYFALLSQESKMNPGRLKFMAIWLLAAHVLDLYWLIMPTYASGVTIGWVELGFPLVGVGMVLLLLSWKSKRYNVVPIGDPKLQRGLDFRL
jgi:hypothetical protein